MENWNPSIVYDMAIERHTEVITRVEAAQRQSPLLGPQPARARIAAALVALAARLAPERPVTAPLGHVGHEQPATT